MVLQDVKLSFAVAQSGMRIEAIHSGAYEQTLTQESSEGAVRLGDFYACEERNILLELWLPRHKVGGAVTLVFFSFRIVVIIYIWISYEIHCCSWFMRQVMPLVGS